MNFRKIRRSDEEVITCSQLVACGFNFKYIEKITAMPHSTLSWCIRNRLPKLDYELYKKCDKVIFEHNHRRPGIYDWTTTVI